LKAVISKNLALACVVILYYPDENVASNIKSYIDFVDHLYIYDNTENPSQKFIRQFKNDKTTYISNNSNNGIAAALNYVCNTAIRSNYKIMLTMDQDSFFDNGDLQNFLKVAAIINWNEVGILTPTHVFKVGIAGNKNVSTLKSVNSCMTSGNIVNLKAFEDNNGFNEDFFIDHVDHEYCYRLINNGYKILESSGISLQHNLGVLKKKKILGLWEVTFVSHSPIRSYYYIRNGLFVYKNFDIEKKIILKLIVKDIIKSLLLEDCKRRRLKIIKTAFFDYLNNVWGKRTF